VTVTHAPPARLDPRRWQALAFVALAQLMVVSDTTVVNIAIPSTLSTLHMSSGDRQWIMGAYALAFGALLLAGGRIADLVGRRRAFLVGLAAFAAASALGGAAGSGEVLITARVLQGCAAALLSPAALAMVTIAFTDPRERGTAFGVYNAVAGSGAAIGLILGGVLTEYLTWRWAYYIGVPFALVAGIGALLTVRDDRRDRGTGAPGLRTLDLPGTALSSLGLLVLVLAVSAADGAGWVSPGTLGGLLLAALLLGGFALVERRSDHPLLPLRIVADRSRAGVYLALGLATMTMFALFLFMTDYLQTVRHWTPVATGLGFLPTVVGMVIGSTVIGARLGPRLAPRVLMGGGFVVAAVGMLLLTPLTATTGYLTGVLPAGAVLGLGFGAAFVPAMTVGTSGVADGDAGIAAGMLNAVQEVGGSIGTVLLNGVATAAAAAWTLGHRAQPLPGPDGVARAADVHGFTVAVWWTVGILLLAALVSVLLVDRDPAREAGTPT